MDREKIKCPYCPDGQWSGGPCPYCCGLKKMFKEDVPGCKDCIEAQKEGYTMCGECSVPYCGACGAMRMSQCDCGPIADND
jgi:hypothetical protein